ncbi:MAG: bifunctional nicotinamidase/pyrazinamidase [Myxococcota bacterium]
MGDKKQALILVDIQKDFMPDGPLPTAGGYEVVPVANRLIPQFEIVAATQDWHPPDHVSFASNHEGKQPHDVIDAPRGLKQELWPDHCIRESEGAEFVEGLDIERIDRVFRKGTDPEIDSYSGFFDNGHEKKTGLGDWLKEREVTDVYLVGVATDVCVKFTALDARQLGFETYVVEDGTRGVEGRPGDIARALDEMRRAGCRIVRSEQVRAA